MTDIGSIIASIFLGELDDHLDQISEAVARRDNVLEEQLHREITIGSLIRFNENARPKYLIGTLATVTAKKHTRVVVKLGEDKGRFSKAMPITTSLGIIDLLDTGQSPPEYNVRTKGAK